ncbi:uncharacterized protein [Mytilus edulis]|uniref:uncharacterized protein n=1 Tax=Mytilus edulis TaxID=6550 RepID=UPI0039EF8883
MSDTEKLHSSPDGSSAHLTGNKDLVDTFSLFKTYLDGKFDTLYKDLAVGNENFKFATKLKPEVSVKRIRSAECRAIMSIQEKKRPHPYRTATATVSASPATMPNQHYVRKTTNSRPFGPADEGNHHLTTSVSTATSLVTGELSAPFSVQNQLSQGHQGNIIFFHVEYGNPCLSQSTKICHLYLIAYLSSVCVRRPRTPKENNHMNLTISIVFDCVTVYYCAIV